jgi:hypothetical protein
MLLGKPMYQNDIRRKNRIANLKLAMAKELLFDQFINILREPKAPTVRKTTKIATIKDATTAKSTKNAKDAKDISDVLNELDENVPRLNATIKITKKIKTKTIQAVAFIKNDKNKKIWEAMKLNCRNKDFESFSFVKQVIAFDSNTTFIITLNNKGFIDEYNRAFYTYKDLLATNQINSEDTIENIMRKVMNTQDTGRLRDINNIQKYFELIEVGNRFRFM